MIRKKKRICRRLCLPYLIDSFRTCSFSRKFLKGNLKISFKIIIIIIIIAIIIVRVLCVGVACDRTCPWRSEEHFMESIIPSKLYIGSED